MLSSEQMINQTITQEVIQNWLINEISKASKKDKADIDINLPVSSYGLDSIHAVGLVGDLEVWLDLDIDPTFIWDYPTVNDMAVYLSGCCALENDFEGMAS